MAKIKKKIEKGLAARINAYLPSANGHRKPGSQNRKKSYASIRKMGR